MAEERSILHDAALPGAPNSPHLSTVNYRLDDYTTLRQRLLVTLRDTFPHWNPDLLGQDGSRDYAVTLIEAFAYLGDVLGLYQDARANELYLETARLESSLLELCRLIDYRPSRGSAALTLQAFLLKEDEAGTIPAGFQVKSAGGDGVAAQVFETGEELEADARWNRLRHVGHDRSGRVLDLAHETGTLLETTYDGLEAGQSVVFAAAGKKPIPAVLHSVVEEKEKHRIGWNPLSLVSGPDSERSIADLTIHAAPAKIMALAERERADEIPLGSHILPLEGVTATVGSGTAVLVSCESMSFAARLTTDLEPGKVVNARLNRSFNIPLRRSTTNIRIGFKRGTTSTVLKPGDMEFTLNTEKTQEQPDLTVEAVYDESFLAAHWGGMVVDAAELGLEPEVLSDWLIATGVNDFGASAAPAKVAVTSEGTPGPDYTGQPSLEIAGVIDDSLMADLIEIVGGKWPDRLTWKKTISAGDTVLIADALGVEKAVVSSRYKKTIYLAEPVSRRFRPIRSGNDDPGTIEIYSVRLEGPKADPVYDVAPARLDSPRKVFVLDDTYDGLEPGSLVVLADGEEQPVAARVTAVALDEEQRTKLTFANRITTPFRILNLRMHGPFTAEARVDGYDRSEAVLAAGTTQLDIDASFSRLRPGDHLGLDDGVNAQAVRVTSVTLGSTTVADLDEPLAHDFGLADLEVLGNVTPVTRGETIEEPALGSGDQSVAGQTFLLRDGPTTYVHDAAAAAGVASTLEVFVDGVRWEEVRTLAASGTQDRHYATEVEEDGQTRIRFGDGVHGAKLPTGKDNVSARHRVGLGEEGNVAAGAIALMPAPLDFIEQTFNLVTAAGGADPETVEETRRLAPVTVRTLDRAVSLADYADLALAYTGIGKARAAWGWIENERRVVLTVASVDGSPLTFAAELHAYLDTRRTGEHRLEILDYRPVPIRLTLEIKVLPDYLRLDTVQRVQVALGDGVDEDGEPGYFHFRRRDLGEDLHLSDIYRCVEAIPGVDHLVARVFCPAADPPHLLDCIFIGEDGLAVGGDPTDAERGLLTITARGGVM